MLENPGHTAFSHGHADHLGNANRLGQATWIANTKELAWLNGSPPPPRTNPSLISARNAETTQVITGDYAVFGDGSVKVLAAPGHMRGSSSPSCQSAEAKRSTVNIINRPLS